MNDTQGALKISTSNKLLVFLSIFVIMFLVTSIISSYILSCNIDERMKLLLTSCFQNLFVFIAPSYIIAKIESKSAPNTLGVETSISLRNIAGIFLIMFIATPMMNQLIFWNQNLSLPNSLKGLEIILKSWEQRNSEITEMLLSDMGVASLIWCILVIGILTPIGEELFFRAGLQRIFQNAMSESLAIWLAATIFSAMHFQFFGFIPRLLLGAFFGYLYIWTRSVWAPILAHALNNTSVVILSYFASKGYILSNFDEFGIDKSGVPWMALGSLILVIIFFTYLKKRFFDGTKNV